MSDEDAVTESFPVFQAEFRPYLQNCWDTMSPPFPESDLKAARYAAIFSEENGSVDCLELDCLRPASDSSSTILEEPPVHFGKDIGMFRAYDAIAGPLKIVYVEGKKQKFHVYPDLFCYFKTLEKEDGKLLFEQQIIRIMAFVSKVAGCRFTTLIKGSSFTGVFVVFWNRFLHAEHLFLKNTS